MFVLGFGCRSLLLLYERFVELNDVLDVLNFVVDNGVIFFDISDFYGMKYSNEKFFGVVCFVIIFIVFFLICFEIYMI